MSKFELNILGCGSATPTMRHMPSCQVVDVREKLFMIDCGEGAQLQMRRMHLKFSRLSHVFISHLHGDHFLGLPGLLSTLALHEKGGSVTIHAFAEGLELLRHTMQVVCHDTPYEIIYEPLDPRGGEVVVNDRSLTVETFPLYHRVPCVGFIFREKPVRRQLLNPAGSEPLRSYAYCSDTVFDARVAESVKGVTTLYHEATYASDNAHKARKRGHSTAAEAAQIAAMAGASKLVIGHYSKSYDSEDMMLSEARAIFPETIAANEGLTIKI